MTEYELINERRGDIYRVGVREKGPHGRTVSSIDILHPTMEEEIEQVTRACELLDRLVYEAVPGCRHCGRKPKVDLDYDCGHTTWYVYCGDCYDGVIDSPTRHEMAWGNKREHAYQEWAEMMEGSCE